PVAPDAAHLDAGPHAVRSDPLDERVDDPAQPPANGHEGRALPASLRLPHRARGAAPQAPGFALPSRQLRIRRPNAEPVDIAGGETTEERRDDRLGRTASEATPRQRPDRLVALVSSRRNERLRDRAEPRGDRHPVPPPEVPSRRGDPEPPPRDRTEPG